LELSTEIHGRPAQLPAVGMDSANSEEGQVPKVVSDEEDRLTLASLYIRLEYITSPS
jgi:hypothetical protein